jgi:adenylyltransferase/sulfurtransferase
MGIFLVLNANELERYDRQMIIEGWGVEGQEKLKSSRATVIGVGGLGCPICLYLSAAGIGTLTMVDDGKFELSNLNRQVLGWTADIDRLKVESVVEKIRSLNPNVNLEIISEKVNEHNVDDIISGSNVVIDALSNWKARFILNRSCVKQGIPMVHAGIKGFYGQAMTIVPGKGPCLSCVIPGIPPEEPRFPVLGTTPGLLAMVQVTEAIKILLGLGEPLIGRMLIYDGTDHSFMLLDVKRSDTCPVCSEL